MFDGILREGDHCQHQREGESEQRVIERGRAPERESARELKREREPERGWRTGLSALIGRRFCIIQLRKTPQGRCSKLDADWASSILSWPFSRGSDFSKTIWQAVKWFSAREKRDRESKVCPPVQLFSVYVLEPPRKVDIRLPGKWEFKLPWRKTVLLYSSRPFSGFRRVGCQ